MVVARGSLSPEKGGDLRTKSTGGKRLLVGGLLSGALLGGPLSLLGSGAATNVATSDGASGGRAAAVAPARLPGVWLGPSELTHFAVPMPSTAPSAPTTPMSAPPTTTTTEPQVVQAPAAVAPAPSSSATGIATWYAAAPAGTCASPVLDFGTTLRITDDATGASITCLVEDREADNPGRVVDLSEEGFSELAPLSQGVIEVTISW